MAGAAGGRASRGLLLNVGLLLAGALLSASTVWWGIGPHDEGLMLQAASRIADGQWPYRDFWWNYGPGQPILLAPFEGSLIAWRAIRIALDAVVALLAYRLALRLVAERPAGEAGAAPLRRAAGEAGAAPLRGAPWAAGAAPLRGARWTALLAWLAVAGAMAWPTGPHPNPAALALGLGGLLLARERPLAAGHLAGLATLFRPEIGIAAAIGVGIAADRAGRVRALAAAAATTIICWLPFLLVAPGELLDQTVGFLGIQDLQRLPFPLDAGTLDPNKLLEFYAPLILVAGTALALVTRPPLALLPLTLAGLLYLLGRTDEFHLVPLAAVLPVVLVAARRARIAALVVVGLIALHGLDRVATLPRDDPAWDARETGDERRVLQAIGDRSIFVAPPRFDRVTVGNPLLYVLAGRPNPTRYDVMQPGVVTTREVQEEIVADLERARPELLIRWLDPRTAPEDNGAGRSSGVTLLDDYLRATYRPVSRFGVYEVHQRGGR